MEELLERSLSAQKCAPLVGTSVSALYKMARHGIVPCLRNGIAGRGVRFIPSEVKAALQARPAWKK